MCVCAQTAEQDIKEGNLEGSSSAQDQPVGSDLGTEAEQRSSSSSTQAGGSGTAGEASGTSQAAQETAEPQGGRFDEEQVMGDHPYDPRPRCVFSMRLSVPTALNEGPAPVTAAIGDQSLDGPRTGMPRHAQQVVHLGTRC